MKVETKDSGVRPTEGGSEPLRTSVSSCVKWGYRRDYFKVLEEVMRQCPLKTLA